VKGDELDDVFKAILALVEARDVRVSEHGYDAMVEDGLTAREIMAGLSSATVLEEYLHYGKGPAVLLLQKDHLNDPIHVVWGIPKGSSRPAVIVTAYRPDAKRWDKTMTKRQSS
jgi:hypothetical protein